MVETKQIQTTPQQKPTGYFLGEVATQVSEVIARPDGTAMSQMEWQIEVLNKLDAIHRLIKDRL